MARDGVLVLREAFKRLYGYRRLPEFCGHCWWWPILSLYMACHRLDYKMMKCTSKNVVATLTNLIASIKHNQASRKTVAALVNQMCEKLNKTNFFEKRGKVDPRDEKTN